uniref:Uncharacterized protein n=1 Tax=Fagus sylvatica TaxID=28930 RepID=A0A2N9EU38_FAGSY
MPWQPPGGLDRCNMPWQSCGFHAFWQPMPLPWQPMPWQQPMPWPWHALAAALACLGSMACLGHALAAWHALAWQHMAWQPMPWHALAHGICLGSTCLGRGNALAAHALAHLPWHALAAHALAALAWHALAAMALPWHALAWAHALGLGMACLAACLGHGMPCSRLGMAAHGALAAMPWHGMPWQHMPCTCLGSPCLGPWQPWHCLGITCLGLASPCLGIAFGMPWPSLLKTTQNHEKRLAGMALGSPCLLLAAASCPRADGAVSPNASGADLALLDASSCLSSLHAWHAVVRLVVLWSSVRDGMTMKSSMCPTAASLRCVVVVDHVGVLVLSVAEHNVERSAPGVHRSARPFYRRCAPGLNWPGRASGAVTLKKLECSKQAYALDTLAWDNIIGFRRTTAKAFAKDVFINQERKLGARRRSDTVLVSTINDADQGLADVTYRTPPAPYEKSKSLGSGGSMVARLKLKGIDGRAPPGVEPAA